MIFESKKERLLIIPSCTKYKRKEIKNENGK